jgi:hypothetical protein
MNVPYGCIDTFTFKIHYLHPILEISNFLQAKLNSRLFSNKWHAIEIKCTYYALIFLKKKIKHILVNESQLPSINYHCTPLN